jgi:hypothetical protein
MITTERRCNWHDKIPPHSLRSMAEFADPWARDAEPTTPEYGSRTAAAEALKALPEYAAWVEASEALYARPEYEAFWKADSAWREAEIAAYSVEASMKEGRELSAQLVGLAETLRGLSEEPVDRYRLLAGVRDALAGIREALERR